MRLWTVALLVMTLGCRSTTSYAVMVSAPPNESCLAKCSSYQALGRTEDHMTCMADCGAVVTRGECVDQSPASGDRCYDASVSRFSFWKTAALVGGIVVAGVLVGVAADVASRR